MARFTDLLREQDNVISQLTKLAGGTPACGDTKGDTESIRAEEKTLTGHHAYDKAIGTMTRAGHIVANEQRVDLIELLPLANELAANLSQDDTLLAQVLSGRMPAGSVPTNCVNVAILATLLGRGCGLRDQDLRHLTLAALLHDIGMFTVPGTIVEKSSRLTAEERALIYDHPRTGAELLARTGQADKELVDIVEHEHERWDGGGYPHRLIGTRIHPYARLIGLADVLDALINPRPYHARMSPHQAVRHLLTEHKTAFPQDARKALLEQISLYPIGTSVLLNTGEQGTVLRLNPRQPLRPVLRLHTEQGSLPKSERVVDLSIATSWHIVDTLTSSQPVTGDA